MHTINWTTKVKSLQVKLLSEKEQIFRKLFMNRITWLRSSSFIKTFSVGNPQLNCKRNFHVHILIPSWGSRKIFHHKKGEFCIFFKRFGWKKKTPNKAKASKRRKKGEIKVLRTRAWALAWILLDLSFTSRVSVIFTSWMENVGSLL